MYDISFLSLSENITWQFFWSVLSGLVVCYALFEAAWTRRVTQKYSKLPLVGSSSYFVPRIVLNTFFALDAVRLLGKGYQKYKTKAFQLVQNDKVVIVLPQSLLQELTLLPSSIASPHAGLEFDLLGSYSRLDLVLETRLHHAIIQRKLTPRLESIRPDLEKELTSFLRECLPYSEAWAKFQPYQDLAKVSARFSAQAITGPAFSHNQTWLKLEVDYVENLFMTIVALRMVPRWTRPVISLFLPSYWRCGRYIKTAKALLSPRIQHLLEENDAGRWTPDDSSEHNNVLSWLIDSVKGKDRNPDTLAHVMVILALASVHTVLLRIVNVLYDLTDHPELLEELRAEIDAVAASPQGWGNSPYDRLHKLDSVLVESQRTSPPTTTGLKRLFQEEYTFSNGLHIPKGSYVCMPVYAIENDPENTPNPEIFDGLRQYRASVQIQQQQQQGNTVDRTKLPQFTSPTPTILNFGYGKAACPGRFFASLEIKMVFVKLLTEYEFKFMPGKGRPANMMLHEFLFTWPWTSMLIRRRKDSVRVF